MDKRIENIISNFDFAKVHKTMLYLEWTWGDKTPTMSELIIHAQKHLEKAIEIKGVSASGGFWAEYFEYEQTNALELRFALASWDIETENGD